MSRPSNWLERERPRSGAPKRRPRVASLTALGDNFGKGKPIASLQAEDQALEEAMRPFLALLTSPQADAVRLVHGHRRMSVREAGAELKVSHVAIIKRLRGAYDVLRTALTEAAGSESYVEVRRWLTPAEVIDVTTGREDKGVVARCLGGGEPLARYYMHPMNAKALGYEEPWLVCFRHDEEGR